ncbi:MAG: molybdopterin-dependent oxidoreductase [Nocardioidaceae bacterium]
MPAATWGDKTGTFTNADRTVHLSEKAVEPPGEAKPDLDIFIGYARRLGLKDKDGAPLVKWHDPESAFEAWKECTRGRPCDYTGMSYDKLRGGSGIQWPCNAEHPDGSERISVDGQFWSDFVLHDMFAVPFDKIAAIVGCSPASARQLASPARRRVQGARRFPMPISPGSGTSSRCSRCSTRTPCCEPTEQPSKRVHRRKFAVRRVAGTLSGSARAPPTGAGRRSRRSRLGPGRKATSHLRLHDHAGKIVAITCCPTPSGYAISIWLSSTTRLERRTFTPTLPRPR